MRHARQENATSRYQKTYKEPPMTWLLYGVCPFIALGMGAAAMLRRSKTRGKRQAAKYTRWAVGSFGSAGIIWSVFILGEMLQLMVIILAISWLAKTLSSKRPIAVPVLGALWGRLVRR
jgi:hypothetical protein